MGIDINALISAASAICVAILTGLFARDSRRRKAADDDQKAHAQMRAKESRDRKSTRLNSSHSAKSRMPSSA